MRIIAVLDLNQFAFVQYRNTGRFGHQFVYIAVCRSGYKAAVVYFLYQFTAFIERFIS